MKTFFERLVKFWPVWPMLFFGGCTGTTVSVINDSEWLQNIGVMGIMVAFLMMAVVIVAALFLRKWAVAFSCAASAVVCVVVGFLAAIMIGVGQHHPPRHAVEDVEEVDTLTTPI